MKTRCLPDSIRLTTVAVLLTFAGVASGAVLNFSAGTTCSSDADVATDGLQVCAYSWGNAGTVNGVSFANSSVSSGSVGSNLSLAGIGSGPYTGYGVSGTPYNSLSSGYQTILKGAIYGGSGAGSATLQNLIVGHTYLVQLWVSDGRSYGNGRHETVSSGGGTNATLDYNNIDANGGVGQFTTAIFVADATSQAITLTPNSSVQINAMQLRDVTATTWTGADATNLWSQTNNWDTLAVPTAGDGTVVFDTNATYAPDLITLDTSYPDGGNALNLNFVYGKDLTIQSTAINELYLNSLKVSDGFSYTLDIAQDGSQNNSGTMAQSGATWDVASGGTLSVLTCFGAKSGVTGGDVNKTGDGTLIFGAGASGNPVGQYLQFNAQGGVTKLGFTSGTTFNGISGISAGATVMIAAADIRQTVLSSGYRYASGVANVAGTFDLNGYDQTITSLSGTSTGLITNSGASNSTLTIGLNGVANYTSGNGTFAGVIADGATGTMALAINPYGSGFVETLSGANTYTGSTTVSGGTLALGSSGSIDNSSSITVASGATFDVSAVTGGYTLAPGQTLAGQGTVTIDSAGATVNGTLAPGTGDIGTLTVSSDGTLNLAGTVQMEITNDSTAWLADQIVAGTVNYGGTLVVTNLSMVALTDGDSFQLFNATNYTGSFSSYVLPTLPSPLVWDTSGLLTSGTITVAQPNGAPTANDDFVTIPEDTLATIPVLTNDTDPENDPLTIQTVTQGANGTVSIVDTNVTYLPNTNWNGSDSFTYTITDGHGNYAAATVYVTVTPVPDNPYFSTDPIDIFADSNVAITGTLADYGVNSDGGPVTYTKTAGPAWLSVATDGALSGIPGAGDAGTNTFTVQLENTNSLTGSATLMIYVRSDVTSVANGQWDVGTTWSDGQVPSPLANYYIDGETVNTPTVANGTILTFGGNSLTANNGGTFELDLKHGDSRTAYYNITNCTIDGGTLRCAATIGSSHWKINTPVTFSGTNNLQILGGNYSLDLSLLGGMSGDGAIDYSVDAGSSTYDNSHLYVYGVSNAFTGDWMVECYDSGSYSRLHASAAGALGTGIISLNLRGMLVNDVANGLDTLGGVWVKDAASQVVLTSPWTGTSAFLSLTEGSTIDLGSGASSVGSMATNGTPVDAGTYDAPQLTAMGLTASGTGTLTVLGSPWAQPVFTNDTLVFPDATQVSAYAGSIAGSASDADAGDTLAFSKVNGPAWLSVAADGTLSGTPGNSDGGTNQFIVRAADTHGLYKDAVLQIYVNQPPVANPATYTRNGLTTWKIAVSDLLTNATDPEGGAVTLSSVSASTNGITLIVSGGYVQYANTNLVDDEFSYTVADNYGVTSSGTVTLTVGSAAGVGGQGSHFTLTGGTASMSFAGIPGYKYNVQVSTNLNDWATLWTTNAPAGGVFDFSDPNPPHPSAYYRLMWNGN